MSKLWDGLVRLSELTRQHLSNAWWVERDDDLTIPDEWSVRDGDRVVDIRLLEGPGPEPEPAPWSQIRRAMDDD